MLPAFQDCRMVLAECDRIMVGSRQPGGDVGDKLAERHPIVIATPVAMA